MVLTSNSKGRRIVISQIPPFGYFLRLVLYIDGGTGSMLLQAALAGLLGGLYLVKSKFGQLRALVSRLRRQKNSDEG